MYMARCFGDVIESIRETSRNVFPLLTQMPIMILIKNYFTQLEY